MISPVFLLIVTAPILMNAMLIVWTAVVSPFTTRGDSAWALYPAVAVFPLVLIWHIGLQVAAHIMSYPERNWILPAYGIANCTVSLMLWVLCLLTISKDSI